MLLKQSKKYIRCTTFNSNYLAPSIGQCPPEGMNSLCSKSASGPVCHRQPIKTAALLRVRRINFRQMVNIEDDGFVNIEQKSTLIIKDKKKLAVKSII